VGPRDDIDVGPRDVDMSPGDDDVVKTNLPLPRTELRIPGRPARWSGTILTELCDAWNDAYLT
jgi:hypothetical protein